MTTGELSQWISRGHYWPSEEVRPGQRRRFDWRDLACLAVINALRKHSLSINVMSLIAGALRKSLAEMDKIPAASGLFLFCANWDELQSGQTIGLISETELCRLLRSHPESMIVVDVAGVYHSALTKLPSEVISRGARP
ncbi:hypothetical protein ADZ37_19095 [Pannonibacter phragmitetus]|nr:hypothetical protein ADZ37_19095 [Pannonibacter phragmitetus]